MGTKPAHRVTCNKCGRRVTLNGSRLRIHARESVIQPGQTAHKCDGSGTAASEHLSG